MNAANTDQIVPATPQSLHVGRRRSGRSRRSRVSFEVQRSLDWQGHLVGWGA